MAEEDEIAAAPPVAEVEDEAYDGNFAATAEPCNNQHVFLCCMNHEACLHGFESSESSTRLDLFTSCVKEHESCITAKTEVSSCEPREGTMFEDGDVLIFPEGIKYKGLNDTQIAGFIKDVLVTGNQWQDGPQESLTGSYIFVRTVGSNDKSSSSNGADLIEKLNQCIKTRGLKDHVYVTNCSHIGGHTSPGNLILYKTGQEGKGQYWTGCVTVENVDQHVLASVSPPLSRPPFPLAPTTSFPPEVIDSIVSRLKPSSMVRFRSLSKRFNTFFTDLYIQEQFFKLKIEEDLRILLQHGLGFDRQPGSYSTYNMEMEPVCAVGSLPSRLHYAIQCELDGMFCLSTQIGRFLYIALWNPELNEVISLPGVPEPPFPKGFYHCDNRVFFGFDQAQKVYKVGSTAHSSLGLGRSNQHLESTSIYDVSTRGWRQLENRPIMYGAQHIFHYPISREDGGLIHWYNDVYASAGGRFNQGAHFGYEGLYFTWYSMLEERYRELCLPRPNWLSLDHALVCVSMYRDAIIGFFRRGDFEVELAMKMGLADQPPWLRLQSSSISREVPCNPLGMWKGDSWFFEHAYKGHLYIGGLSDEDRLFHGPFKDPCRKYQFFTYRPQKALLSEVFYDLRVEDPPDACQYRRTCLDVQRLHGFKPIEEHLKRDVERLMDSRLSKGTEIFRFTPPQSAIDEVQRVLKINKTQLTECWEILIYLKLHPVEKYMDNISTMILWNRVKDCGSSAEQEGGGQLKLVDERLKFIQSVAEWVKKAGTD